MGCVKLLRAHVSHFSLYSNKYLCNKLTKLSINFENKIENYEPDQVPESKKRISVKIEANKKNSDLFITGLSRFLTIDARVLPEGYYDANVLDNDTIMLIVTDKKLTHKETVLINRITGRLEYVTYHKDGQVETLYYNCNKAAQKF